MFGINKLKELINGCIGKTNRDFAAQQSVNEAQNKVNEAAVLHLKDVEDDTIWLGKELIELIYIQQEQINLLTEWNIRQDNKIKLIEHELFERDKHKCCKTKSTISKKETVKKVNKSKPNKNEITSKSKTTKKN